MHKALWLRPSNVLRLLHTMSLAFVNTSDDLIPHLVVHV